MSQFFGEAVHAAFVVPDIEIAISRIMKSGIGPAYFMRRMRVAGRFRGMRHDVLITAAFVNTGPMQYEFIQQHDDTPSTYLEFLEQHPEGGMHHIAYFCGGFEGSLNMASQNGQEFRIVQEFITPDGQPFEIYVEPIGASDPLLIQLMLPSPISKFFEQVEEIAANWDGKDPVRNAFDLLPAEMVPPLE